jgi:trans-2,3-dihydro-3-hydroxyanthranilate isomerase
MKLNFRILNVFTDGGNPFSGNPLCVFEDATGLSDHDMQNLARQLNLSETTFITLDGEDVSANVRHLHAQLRDALRRAPDAGHGIR